MPTRDRARIRQRSGVDPHQALLYVAGALSALRRLVPAAAGSNDDQHNRGEHAAHVADPNRFGLVVQSENQSVVSLGSSAPEPWSWPPSGALSELVEKQHVEGHAPDLGDLAFLDAIERELGGANQAAGRLDPRKGPPMCSRVPEVRGDPRRVDD